MKNKLSDLNNHLFAQLERLGNEDMNTDELKAEIERSRAITMVGNTIVSNARLSLDAQNAMFDTPNYERKVLPAIFELE